MRNTFMAHAQHVYGYRTPKSSWAMPVSRRNKAQVRCVAITFLCTTLLLLYIQSHFHPQNNWMPSRSSNSALSFIGQELDTNRVNTSSGCRDDYCVSILKIHSAMCFKLCEELSNIEHYVPPGTIPRRCKFRSNDGHDPPVALVSVPGSGNTWVRGLLELATGICTGSIYCDSVLRAQGFVGEHVRDGSVLLVKTHTSDFQWSGDVLKKRNIQDAYYGAALLLLRNPYNTFVAERHRLVLKEEAEKKKIRHKVDASHLARAEDVFFSNESNWDGFVVNITARWKKTVTQWLSPSNHSVLVLRYEDIRKDVTHQIERILQFLQEPYRRPELVKRIAVGYEDFQRSLSHQWYQKYYTISQRKMINTMILQTVSELKHYNLETFGISDYVWVA